MHATFNRQIRKERHDLTCSKGEYLPFMANFRRAEKCQVQITHKVHTPVHVQVTISLYSSNRIVQEHSNALLREKQGKEEATVAVLAFALPILPGKQEAWRRFCQELLESRFCEYQESRQRLGITREVTW